MPKANKGRPTAGKAKAIAYPTAGKKMKKDFGVPKFTALKDAIANNRAGQMKHPSSRANLDNASKNDDLSLSTNAEASSSTIFTPADHIDPALTIRDSSARAFTRELKKVIERSDVILQVLDARDPEGTRSRWVEDEVRKREGDGKKLIGVVNKIDLVPRSNLEAWIRHLRHSFPTMPFKASTQAQRNNLSQSTVQILPTAGSGSSGAPQHAALPSISASLGAPALLHLLKQYALTRPHQTLTVGVIGYPNVGKSSLINSLKRSRACAVAAMPGKTRVIQEIVLDKGVKILDCPGVVLEDFGSQEGDEHERRRRQGAVMLRNCLKVEEVEDPIAPVDAILGKVEPSILMDLYSVPAFENVTEFLVTVALTRGRLGKGGIPDLEAAATMILRDWNAGRIPYHTQPPLIHPSARPQGDTRIAVESDTMAVDGTVNDGDAILNGLGAAFDLEGLFNLGGELKEGEETWLPQGGGMEDMPIDEEFLDGSAPQFTAPAIRPLVDFTSMANPAHQASSSRLFTPAELEMLPMSPFDRKALKKQAKKTAKVAKEHAEATMDLDGLAVVDDDMEAALPATSRPVKAKKKISKLPAKGIVQPVVISEEAEKEMEFMAFLNQVGADEEDDDSMEWNT